MMTVKDLLIDHLEQTYEREGWYPPLGLAIKGLTAEQAAWKPSPERHSIWQIVRHLIHWKSGVLRALDGDPPDYDEMSRGDWGEASGDQAAWEADVEALAQIYGQFRQRIEALGDDGLQQAVRAYQQSPQPLPIARRLTWIFTHDAYHAGQIQYLRALQGIPSDRFFAASGEGNVGRMRDVLAAHGALLNAHSRDGWTALQLAAYYGHADAVRHLLARGADVHVRSQNAMANTALHGAIAGRRTEIVPLLLEAGADLEAPDAGGNTSLHLAAHEGLPEIIRLLVERGTSINARRSDGKTPLGVALAEAQAEAADALRQAGGTE